MNERLGNYIDNFVNAKNVISVDKCIFEYKKSTIHGDGTFLINNCKINKIYNAYDKDSKFWFNDIHFNKVLEKLGINCETRNDKGDKIYMEEFVKLPEYDTFIEYYLDEETTINDSDVKMLDYNHKFVVLRKKEIGDELFRCYGIDFWFMEGFLTAVNLYTLEELKVHPMIIKINELLMFPNFNKIFCSLLKNNFIVTSINKNSYFLKIITSLRLIF